MGWRWHPATTSHRTCEKTRKDVDEAPRLIDKLLYRGAPPREHNWSGAAILAVRGPGAGGAELIDVLLTNETYISGVPLPCLASHSKVGAAEGCCENHKMGDLTRVQCWLARRGDAQSLGPGIP